MVAVADDAEVDENEEVRIQEELDTEIEPLKSAPDPGDLQRSKSSSTVLRICHSGCGADGAYWDEAAGSSTGSQAVASFQLLASTTSTLPPRASSGSSRRPC